MGDIFDEVAGVDSPGLAPQGDIFDQVAASTPEPSFFEKRWQDVKDTPSTIYNMFSEIPSGIKNLGHLSGDFLDVGKDAANLAALKLGILNPKTPEEVPKVQADYGRIDRTLHGIASLDATGLGARAGAIVGLPSMGAAAATSGLNMLLKAMGDTSLPDTTSEQDLNDFFRNSTQFALLGGALKGTGKIASGIGDLADTTANALDRRSIGARMGDYGSKSNTRTIETPEGEIGTFVKSQLNSLLEDNALGLSRKPSNLLKIIEANSGDLNRQVGDIISEYDRVNPETGLRVNPEPTIDFPNAERFLASDKVKSTDLVDYTKKLANVKNTLAENSDGTLRYLQEQKKAYGDSYNPLDRTSSAFDRAIYRDLKTAVEKHAPEVKDLNSELSKYIITEPIVERMLRQQDAASPADALKGLLYTTGGVGAPMLAGMKAAGFPGAVVGAGVGLATKALASPTGQALAARGLRGVGSAAGAIGDVLGTASTPSSWTKSEEVAPTEAPSAISRVFGDPMKQYMDAGGQARGGDVMSQYLASRGITPEQALHADILHEDNTGLFSNVERTAPPEYAHIEDAAIRKLKESGPDLIKQYVSENTQNGALKLDTDLARKYVSDSDVSQGTHEAASALVKEVGRQALADPSKPKVTILLGAPASGKTTVSNKFTNGSDIIFDKIIKSKDAGASLIDSALANGKKVTFQFVYSKPEITLERAWNRAVKENRAVPIEHFSQRAIETTTAFHQLAEHYKDNPNVIFQAIDNSKGIANAHEIGVDEVGNLAYNHIKEGQQALDQRLRAQLKQHYETTNQQSAAKASSLYEQFSGEKPGLSTPGSSGDSSAIQSQGTPGDAASVRGALGEVQRENSGVESAAPYNTENIPPEMEGLAGKVLPASYPIVNRSISQIKEASDIPNFKRKSTPLQGSMVMEGKGPLQVLIRKEIDPETGKPFEHIFSGRHSLNHALATGTESMPQQLYFENKGFTPQMARDLDAQLNMRSNQGEVSDYAKYIHDKVTSDGLSPEEAKSKGILRLPAGQMGYQIGTNAVNEVYAAHQSGLIPDNIAAEIAKTAPGNSSLQRGVLQSVLDKMKDGTPVKVDSIQRIVDSAKKTARIKAGDTGPTQTTMFDDDQAVKDAVAKDDIATEHIKELTRRIRSGQGSASNPEGAAQDFNIDVKDAKSAKIKVNELKAERAKWQNWVNDDWASAQIDRELMAQKGETAPTEPTSAIESVFSQGSAREPLRGSMFKGETNPKIQDLFGLKTTGNPSVNGNPSDSAITSIFSKGNKVKNAEFEIKANPYYNALAETESSWNPKAHNPDSSAKGLFQLIDSTAKSLGVRDPFDIGQSFEGVKKLTEEHAAKFGDDPKILYAAHFLGEGLLRKWINNKDLTEVEQSHVNNFENQALPRFERIYNNLTKEPQEA